MKKDLRRLLYLFFIFIFILMMFMVFVKYSSQIETITNTILIENYVYENNLNMPFPYWETLGDNNLNIDNLMSKNLTEFHKTLEKNYIYSELYDCKYWSFIWSNYWAYNKDKFDLKVIRTDNHIFAILYNENVYCVADQKNLNCIDLINN
jgi:hypothetical protein